MSKIDQYTKNGCTYIFIPNVGIAEHGEQKMFMSSSKVPTVKDIKKNIVLAKKIQSIKTRK